MAYNGYRLKINNVVFNNSDIAKGSYTLGKNPRVAKSYTDINGIRHDIYYPTPKTIISFSIREHLLSDHLVSFVLSSVPPFQISYILEPVEHNGYCCEQRSGYHDHARSPASYACIPCSSHTVSQKPCCPIGDHVSYL